MDHLQTDQERRARWYSHTLPQYVPVELAKQPVDLVNLLKSIHQSVWSSIRMATKKRPKNTQDLLASVLDERGFVVGWSLE
jgi:hypothetical protein